ncbi:hypothetical protein PsB1_2281 [Candidatus Phycosocius spiralis]|uniref:Putative auto-transporter adhesin head GIN domain-containing protein n=2 Tax=Candidatus Phycosocius spiralis TaxID=2815099 RepID=A0ABQ4PYN5_9PROT|nr:hypothetical protein PsB1_2281 [Candidatus Phycosocius spiralis]
MMAIPMVKHGLIVAVISGAAFWVAGPSAQAQAMGDPRLLELDGFAGQVEIKTAQGAVFDVQIVPGAKLSAKTERAGTLLRVIGPIKKDSSSRCSNYNSNGRRVKEIKLNGERFGQEDLPRLVVTAPSTIGLRIKHSLISGRVGDVGGATIGLIGCGDFFLGNVAKDLELNATGSGDVRVGRIGGDLTASYAGSGNYQTQNIGGRAEVSLAGSGNSQIGSVSGAASINLAGSGDIIVASVQGPLEVNVAGSGDLKVLGGRSRLEANIAGSGTIRHAGTVIDPQINIIGTGDVSVDRVEGTPTVSKLGSGDFRVD